MTRPRTNTMAKGARPDDAERCCICLMQLRDRARSTGCAHSFCFTCIGVWAQQSRKCPLCSAEMGDYLEHDLDHCTPTKFFLPPLPEPGFAPRTIPSKSPSSRSESGPASASSSTFPALAAAIERRREIYSEGLYARHVAANEWTGYSRSLTPPDLASGDERARALAFLERELRVWAPPHDVPHLAQHLVKLLTSIDVRSEAAVRMLEPLVGDTYPHAAEHLTHELAAFLRSPFPLDVWDDVVQYGRETFPEARREGEERGRSRSRSRSVSDRSRSRHRDVSRSRSRSSSRAGLHNPAGARRDSYRPRSRSGSRSASPASARRWDQGDSWVDPEYRKSRRGGRRERERRERERNGGDDSRGHGLLDRVAPPKSQAFQRAVAGAGIEIRGAADRRQSLLERLARAKAQGDGEGGNEPSGAPTESAPPVAGPPAATAESNGHAAGGDRAAELREKLMVERKARHLREQLLARKRARNAIAEAAQDVQAHAKRSPSREKDEASRTTDAPVSTTLATGVEAPAEPAPTTVSQDTAAE